MVLLKEKIKKQIEFYFSDANMRTDKFMQEKTKENEGWVDFTTLLLFKKLKALSADQDIIKDAIKDSAVVEHKLDDQLYVRKIVTEDYLNYLKKDNDKKVLSIKGFDKNASFDDIEIYLRKYMDFVVMRMIRNKEKEFVGIVFVELRNEEDVEKALAGKIPLLKTEKEELYNKKSVENEEVADGTVNIANEEQKENIAEGENNDDIAVKRPKINEAVLENFLHIQRKGEYFKDRRDKIKQEKENKKRNLILEKLNGKFYKYSSNNEVDIKTVKNIVPDVAFVDHKNNTLRFKKNCDFEDKTYEKEETKIHLKKLTAEEEAEYVKDIKFSEVLSKGNRKSKKTKK